ncbi:hypothetical protein, partial [uncultured Ruminococcus sp.]|uniref:hypothetical protein n=1 Tax=uncultured Ruminococcus sp. TaxID=165186 RepID=UPI00259276FC
FSSIFPKYLGKYARKMRAGRYETGSDGKFASRWRAKSSDALCAVLPLIYVFHYFNMFSPKKQVPHPIPYKIFKKHGQHRKTVL